MRNFFSKRLKALSVLLLICAVLAQFGSYYWVFDLLVHLTWHYFLFGLFLTVILLILKQYRWAVLPLLVAMFQIPILFDWQNTNEQCLPSYEQESIELLQFNVSRTNNQQQKIIDWIESLSTLPDVIVFIEVTTVWKPYIDLLHKKSYPYVLAQYENDNYGMAILSTLPDTELELKQFGSFGINSIEMTAKSSVQNTSLHLIAAHPPPPITMALSNERDKQLQAISVQINAEKIAHKIVLGDLNITSWSSVFKTLLQKGGLIQAKNKEFWQNTWPSFLPQWLGIPIDHTLISPNIRLKDRKIITDLGSDHRAVLTQLYLGKNSCD